MEGAIFTMSLVPPLFIFHFIKKQLVMLITAIRNIPGLQGLYHLAARFVQMAAAAEFAVLRIGGELPEAHGQLIHSQLQEIELAEAWSVGHKSAVTYIHQLNM